MREVLLDLFAYDEAQAAIGPQKSYDAYKLSILTNGLKYSLVTFGGSFDSLAKSKTNFLFRTVPADSFRVMAMINLMQKMNWNYISIISSHGRNGDNSAQTFIKKIPAARICQAYYSSLPETASMSDYINTVKAADADKKARGLVLFTTIEDAVGVIRALKYLNLTRRFQIVAAFGFTNNVEITKGNEEILDGSVSLEYATTEIPKFRDYFLASKPSNKSRKSIFDEFWEETFQCYLKTPTEKLTKQCTTNDTLQPGIGYYPNTPVQVVIDAVFSLAYALKYVMGKKCNASGYCGNWQPVPSYRYADLFLEFFRNNSFPDNTVNLSNYITNTDPYTVKYEVLNFVRNGSGYVNKKIGSWSFRREWNKTGTYYLDNSYNGTLVFNKSDVRWREDWELVTSSCRLTCGIGERKVISADYKLKKCCWSCIKCNQNEISSGDVCVKCEKDKRPDIAKKSCSKLPITYFGLSANDSLALMIYMGFSSFGILCTIFVIIVFAKNNENRIVRASGRELCYIMLAGILIVFLTPFLFYLEPSSIACSLRVVIPGLAFCICYAPLFLKTNRIYRIFCSAQSSITRPPLISPKSQLLLLLCISCVQVLLGVIWIVSKNPGANKYYPENGNSVVLNCGSDGSALILNLLFSVVFMVCCTWYAFKTRNFPKNYNESKFIGFTMYITCICWAVFLPAYFISQEDEKHMRAHLLCVVTICIAFLTILGLFGQKMKLLLFPCLVDESEPQQQQQSKASRAGSDVNRYQVQMKIHKIDPLSMCKEESRLHSDSVIVNKNAEKS